MPHLKFIRGSGGIWQAETRKFLRDINNSCRHTAVPCSYSTKEYSQNNNKTVCVGKSKKENKIKNVSAGTRLPTANLVLRSNCCFPQEYTWIIRSLIRNQQFFSVLDLLTYWDMDIAVTWKERLTSKHSFLIIFE